MAEINEIVSNKAIEDAIKLLNTLGLMGDKMENVIKNTDAMKKKLDEIGTSSSDATVKTTAYQKILSEVDKEQVKINATAKEMQNQQKQLATVTAKLNAVNDENTKTLVLSKKQLAEQNDITKLNTIINDKNSGSIEKANAYTKLLEIEKKKLNLETKEGTERLKEINAQQDKNNDLVKISSNKLQEQKIGIGNYRDGFSGLLTAFKNGEIGLGGLTKGFFAVGKATLVALWPVGLIAAALGSLYAVFKNFAPLLDKIEQGFASLTAAWGVLKNSLGQFLSGNQSLKESMGGLGTSIKQAAMDAIELKKAEQNLADATGGLEVANKKLDTQMQQLLLQSKNKTLSEKERMDLIDQAIALENQQFENEKRISDESTRIAFENIRVKNKLTEEQYSKLKELGLDYAEELKDQGVQISDADVDRLKEALLKSEDIEQKKIAIVEKAMNRRDVLEEKAEEKRQKISEENKKLAEEQAKQLADQAQHDYEMQLLLIQATSKSKEEADQRTFEFKKESLLKTLSLYEQELKAFKGSELEKLAIQEKINKARFDLEKSGMEERQKLNENAPVKLIDSSKKTADQLKKIDQKQTDDLINSTIRANNAREIAAKENIESTKEKEQRRKEIIDTGTNAAIEIQGALFNFMDNKYSSDLEKLEQKNAAGLLSEKEYATQKAEIEIKQAKMAKLRGIFETTINTASAIVGMLKDPGGIPGTIMAVAAGVTGALQIASIVSQPLPTMPTFAKGTKNAPSLGLAGEAGTELGITSTGEAIIFSEPTIFSGNKFKGMRIYSNPEFEAMKQQVNNPFHSGSSSYSDKNVVKGLKAIEKGINNIKIPFPDGSGYRQGNHTERFINNYRV